MRGAVVFGCLAAACWSEPAVPPVKSAVPSPPAAPRLERGDRVPGRLIYDRSGGAWEVHCNHGKRLTVSPWQGGSSFPIGDCQTADHAELAAYDRDHDPIAIGRGGIARFAAGLRDEVEVERVLDAMRRAAEDAVEPTVATVWQRDRRGAA